MVGERRTTLIAEVIIEREFGSDNFLDLYSNYVSKKIIELLDREKCMENETVQQYSE